jgi:hypothetical protein
MYKTKGLLPSMEKKLIRRVCIGLCLTFSLAALVHYTWATHLEAWRKSIANVPIECAHCCTLGLLNDLCQAKHRP